VDILEQGEQSNFYGPQFGPNAPRRQPVAQGYEQPRSQQRQAPQQSASSYPYGQSVPPPLDKTDYYSTPASFDQQDVFKINPHKPSKKPWFRTVRGLLILLIVLLVLAGAGVGIALGVVPAINKSNANKKGVQQGSQSPTGGVPPSSAGGDTSTNDPNALPTLPSLNLITLSPTRQSAAPATTQANLAISLNLNPAPSASAIVQTRVVPTRPAATTPAQVTRTAPSTAGPTLSVDPVCARFPTLPSCRQR